MSEPEGGAIGGARGPHSGGARASLLLSDDEEAIRATAEKLAREHMPLTQLRALRDRHDGDGFSRDAWRAMAELGLYAAALPERSGGAGLGWAALGVVVGELGRTLATAPWLSTAVLGAGALVDGGNDALAAAHLPAVCRGERLLALAHDEGPHHQRSRVATRAERRGAGFVLHGNKMMVLDGHVADGLVVSARVGGNENDDRDGRTLFFVPTGSAGLGVERRWLVDSRNVAAVRLDGVAVGDDAVLGGVGGGAALLDRLLDRATILLGAEMLGSVDEAFARTVAYLKTRRQFGVPIGSFQALQHRAAQLFCEIELLRSAVRDALRALDADRADVPLAACVVKARAADTFLLGAAEAVQLHGGIGVTDELDIGFFYKRAQVAACLFGDAAYQRDRFAALMGY